jgi:multidrug efflux pump
LGLDLATAGQELGTVLGGAYVNRFNYFDRSYKVIPQIGDQDRATVGPLLDLKIKSARWPARAGVVVYSRSKPARRRVR